MLLKKLADERESKLRAMTRSTSNFNLGGEESAEGRHEKSIDHLLNARVTVLTRCQGVKGRISFKMLQAQNEKNRLDLIIKSNASDNISTKDTREEEQKGVKSVKSDQSGKSDRRGSGSTQKESSDHPAAKKGKSPPSTDSPLITKREREKVREREKDLDRSLIALEDANLLSVHALREQLLSENKAELNNEDSLREKWLQNPEKVILEDEIKNLRVLYDQKMVKYERNFKLFSTLIHENCEKEGNIKNHSLRLLESKKMTEKSPLSDMLKTDFGATLDLQDSSISELMKRELAVLQKCSEEMLLNDFRVFECEKEQILHILSLAATTGGPYTDSRKLQNLLHQKILERKYCDNGKTSLIDLFIYNYFPSLFLLISSIISPLFIH